MADTDAAQRQERLQRIERLFVGQQFADALEAMNAALVTESRNPHLLSAKALCLFMLKRYEEALDTARAALPLHRDILQQASVWCLQGGSLVHLHRYEEALAALDHATALQPDLGDAWMYRGEALRRLGQPSAALEALDRALAIKAVTHRSDTDIVLKRGRALMDLRRFGEALDAFDDVLQREPDNLDALQEKVQCLEQLGRVQDAQQVLDATCAHEPLPESVRADVLTLRARLAQTLGHHAEANADYDEVLARDPDRIAAWIGKAGALERLGHLREALDAYDHAIAHGDQGWFTQVRRVHVLDLLKRYAEALSASERALALAQGPAEVAITQAHHAEILRHGGRRAEAMAVSAAALAADPSSTYVWTMRLRTLFWTGHWIAAVRAVHEMFPVWVRERESARRQSGGARP